MTQQLKQVPQKNAPEVGLIAELRRRNVIKVAIAYSVVSWVLMQIADVFFPALQLPPWSMTLVAVILILGFPIALIFAWAFELTPEGIKRDHAVDHRQSVAVQTGNKPYFVIIGVMAVALIYFAFNHEWSEEQGSRSIGTASGQSIAVLPFTNRSALDEDVFLSTGCTMTC